MSRPIYNNTATKLLNYFKNQNKLPPLVHKPLEAPKIAAVLIPIIEQSEQLTLLFTLRTEHLFDHPGQICFPGGRITKSDRDLSETALRETEEEVGLSRKSIRLLGHLNPVNTRTGVLVTPFVGLISSSFSPKINNFEVAEVFELPLSEVLDASNHQQKHYIQEGEKRTFYAIDCQGRYIWGVTAAILLNLAKIFA